MFTAQPETYLLEDEWSVLNNSRATHNHPDLANYYALLAALDSGWEVESPVYLRPDWSLARKDSMVFHFVLILRPRRMTTLLSVPDSETIRRFIDDNGWAISPPES